MSQESCQAQTGGSAGEGKAQELGEGLNGKTDSERESLRSEVRGQPQGLMVTDASGKAMGTERWAGSQLESLEAGGSQYWTFLKHRR